MAAMKLFRQIDPVAAAAEAEARIAVLMAERTDAIAAAEDNYLAAVAKIDAEITALRANIAIYAQRVEIVAAKHREQALREREREKAAGIAEVRRRLTKRHEAARKLDAALDQVRVAFAELLKAEDEAFSNFPPTVSSFGRLTHFRIDGIEALSAHRMQRPPLAGPVRAIAEREPFNFGALIEAKNRETIELLEAAPLVEQHEEVAA